MEKEHLARLRAQVDAEAAKRVAGHRAKAGAAVARMQGRGESLTNIAARTDSEIGIVSTMARHAPKPPKSTAGNGSYREGMAAADNSPAGTTETVGSSRPCVTSARGPSAVPRPRRRPTTPSRAARLC